MMYILVNFFFMVSNMYDQCSHCFKMYHVNINILSDHWLQGICLADGGWWRSHSRGGSACPQDEKGFPLDRAMWSVLWGPSLLWLCQFPKGTPQLFRLGCLKWKECCMSPPGEHPLALGAPHAPQREQLYFLRVVFLRFLLNLMWVCAWVWSSEDSFSQKTTVKMARPLDSFQRFCFSDIWPTFPSR